MMKRILFIFLLSICVDAFGLFNSCDVVYVGTESEVSELRQLIESVAKNISTHSISGKKLIDILDSRYLAEYVKQNTSSPSSSPKILIQFGSKTSFSPSDLTGSPGRLPFDRRSVLEQQNLMDELDNVSFELTNLLKTNEDLINEAYGLCPNSTKSAVLKLKYKSVVQNLEMFDSSTQEKLKKLIEDTEVLETKKKDIGTKLELLKSSSPKGPKSKDLNIIIKKDDSKLYTPGCILAEGNNVLVAPNETPFEVIFAHELIHLKHYLEEQIFRVDSLKVVADFVFQRRDQFPDIGTFSTEEETLSKLLESSTMRSNIFFRFPIEGNDKLVWNVRDLKNLPLLAYSIAGELSESSIKAKGISLPEIMYRKPGVLSELVGDLEERRTVLGSDRDGITENIIRMEMNLPLRYIYQGSLQAMFEKKETVATILGEDSIDYILKNSSKWTKDKDVEFLKQDALKNKLSVYEKETLSDD